jgi:hypothetical protein
VNRTLDLALAAGSAPAPGIGVIGAIHSRNSTFVVLFDSLAFDNVGVSKADLSTRFQSVKLPRRFFQEVVALDPDFARKRHIAGTELRTVRVIGRFHHLDLSFGIVFDNYSQRVDHGKTALRGFVQVVPDTAL